MPASNVAAVRKQIAQGRPDPIYLLLGDDEAEMSRLAGDMSGLVEEELRAFNVERVYATDRAVTANSIVEAARLVPMISPFRVVTVLRAEKLLKPKRKGKAEEVAPADDEQSAPDADALEAYAKAPQPSTVLVLVASDVDRSRRLYKSLQKTATIVECWGLKGGRDVRVDPRQMARQAEGMVKQAAADAGVQIEASASRLVAERAGSDIAKLRGDVERLMLYAAGSQKISLSDAQATVSGATSQDDWAITTAIERGNAAAALKALALSLESGAVPFMILGQLGWFVREKLVMTDPRRLPLAVDALFRTDLEMKNSGDPRVLLERLVVDLCATPARSQGTPPR